MTTKTRAKRAKPKPARVDPQLAAALRLAARTQRAWHETLEGFQAAVSAKLQTRDERASRTVLGLGTVQLAPKQVGELSARTLYVRGFVPDRLYLAPSAWVTVVSMRIGQDMPFGIETPASLSSFLSCEFPEFEPSNPWGNVITRDRPVVMLVRNDGAEPVTVCAGFRGVIEPPENTIARLESELNELRKALSATDVKLALLNPRG